MAVADTFCWTRLFGTCQLAPWDHAFLGAFWAYNTGSVGTFHWFWYAQQVRHVVDDWTLSAPSINGWLRSFLWAESAQVIQAYATPCSWLSLAFLTGHFVWALSLMFLFSGRGYWQELVESLLWVHVKLQLVPSLQPRALSITIGRAVGVIHFLAGGIGVSWAFTVCRLLQQIAEMLKCAIEAVFMVPSVGLGWLRSCQTLSSCSCSYWRQQTLSASMLGSYGL